MQSQLASHPESTHGNTKGLAKMEICAINIICLEAQSMKQTAHLESDRKIPPSWHTHSPTRGKQNGKECKHVC
jgi:hypothetical protein